MTILTTIDPNFYYVAWKIILSRIEMIYIYVYFVDIENFISIKLSE